MGRECRPLTAVEVGQVLTALGKTDKPKRNRCIFMMMLLTGERPGAVLKLTIGDVMHGKRIDTHVSFRAKTRKGTKDTVVKKGKLPKGAQSKGKGIGKAKNRRFLISVELRDELFAWLNELIYEWEINLKSNPLFPAARWSNNARDLSYKAWYKLFKGILENLGIHGDLFGTAAPYSVRKGFVEGMGESLDRVVPGTPSEQKLNTMMSITGHKSADSLLKYIPRRTENTAAALADYEKRMLHYAR